ncbi:MAG: restriction endonuclease subunit S [Bacteroidales bacterium]|nr:restriction endonuclease subunit S [Bacteroidales bacterium]
MNPTYHPLLEYIREVNVRNSDLKVTNLLGVSVTKEFMPSIANTIGTDMSTYKIVEKGQFVYIADTSRRGDKIAIALLSDYDNAIVSQAYTIFEIIDHEALLPEYLMMWFRRPEFDRYARFHSHGSAREVFDWDELCDVKLPVPPIARQRELVAEYETLTRRIRLNEQMIAKLEETAQALYRKMFVEGIDKEKLPEGWRMGRLGEYCTIITKGTTPDSFSETGLVNYVKAESITSSHNLDESRFSYISEYIHKNELKRSILQKDDILFTIAGTLGKFCKVPSKILPANTNQAVAIIRVNPDLISCFAIYGMFIGGFHVEYCKRNIQQAVQANYSLETIHSIPILIPDDATLSVYTKQMETIITNIDCKFIENEKLKELLSLLLAKMGK